MVLKCLVNYYIKWSLTGCFVYVLLSMQILKMHDGMSYISR